MIILNLKGGVGNQMFQYAFGRKLALQNEDVLKLEVEGLARANEVGDIYRAFALDAFAIDNTIATAEEVRKLKYPYGIVSKGLRWFRAKVLKQTNNGYMPHALNQTGDLFLDGYWQSPRYFSDIRDTLLAEFQLRTPLSAAVSAYKEQMSNSNSVSIHVRRGDYTKNPQVKKEFGICEASYYQRAVAHVEQALANPTFFIFSDDIDWVKEHISLPASAVFVQDPTLRDVEELSLMSMCAHNIIANSTFSWWAAWLNQNPDKVVVAPTPWYETARFDAHLIPSSWIQLPKT
jgi:hypothetical protein